MEFSKQRRQVVRQGGTLVRARIRKKQLSAIWQLLTRILPLFQKYTSIK